MMTLNHGLSGYVCGRVAMPLMRRWAPLRQSTLGWAAFLGAMLPDLDVLARLAGRANYFSGAWYGHRGASHSVTGTLVLATVAALLLYKPLAGRDRAYAWRPWLWLVGVMWAAGLVHIVGDLFTPGMPMPVLWPLDLRVGAFRHIGWFSPYILWLFLTTLVIDATLRGAGGVWPRLRTGAAAAAWGLYLAAGWRWLDFMVNSRYGSRYQWMEYHRDLLPEAMITPLSRGVSAMWFWLTG